MFVPLPELDDRRFADLVEQGRALIPVYAPGWTDHNEHDPGITLMEVLAYVTETAMYRVDRIPDRHVLAFLELMGSLPLPAAPASAVVELALKPNQGAIDLPLGTTFAATLLDGESGSFESCAPLSVLPTTLVAVQIESAGRFRDLTATWARGTAFALLGDEPALGDAVYLGFDRPLTAGSTLRLELELAGPSASRAELLRIEAELAAAARCTDARRSCVGVTRPRRPVQDADGDTIQARVHHDARLVWELQIAPGTWLPLEVDDETRAASSTGAVRLRSTQASASARTGAADRPLHYVRARLAVGALDAAPVASALRANAIRVRQSAPVRQAWPIARGVVALGNPPHAGDTAWLSFEFTAGAITALQFAEPGPDSLAVKMMSYKPATDLHPGQILVEAGVVGTGDGSPYQHFAVPGPYALPGGFELWSLESGVFVRWQACPSLLGRGAADSNYVLDAAQATLWFGDGQDGRVPPAGATLIVRGRSTAGAAGNVPSGSISALGQGTPVAGASALAALSNPRPATDGLDPETLHHAEGRAFESVERPFRAVTLEDYESLALETPGVQLSRAAARANFAPGLDCYEALGVVTLVVVPFLPRSRPVPSPGLLRAVSRYLERRRVLGTRLIVTGPEYLGVAVTATVSTARGSDKTAIGRAVEQGLTAFIDPLTGGPDGNGWPLGRDVFVSEILATIAAVPGVDHVDSIALTVPGCDAQCGDVCLRPLALAVSGAHHITVSSP